MTEVKKQILDYFLPLARVDTQSVEGSKTLPSNPNETVLCNGLLTNFMTDAGLVDITLQDFGISGVLPGSEGVDKSVGLFAHMDTAPTYSGLCNPRVVTYDGCVKYPEDDSIEINDQTNPELADLHGEELVVSSGDSLLGADNKAGIAIILAVCKSMKDDHPEIRVAFTFDEEIGCCGVTDDLYKFFQPCDICLNLDGGLPSIQDQTFIGKRAVVEFSSPSIHPGEAYQSDMRNTPAALGRFLTMFPSDKLCMTTKDKEPYILCTDLKSEHITKVSATLILRAFTREDMAGLEEHVQTTARECAAEVDCDVSVSIVKQYDNMGFSLTDDAKLYRDILMDLFNESGLKLMESTGIRGGLDASILAEKGIPCVNVFTGAANFHALTEFLVVSFAVASHDLMVKFLYTSFSK
ncbi:hypothetical protein PCE1_004300 [Barthelona sp. PCE]